MQKLLTASRFRLLFGLALAVTLFFALVPHPPALPIDSLGDKFEHMTAFAVLTVLARLGFRGMRDLTILVWLSLLGAMIEVLQALPLIHRDCDWRDWLADTIAVLAVLLLLKLFRNPDAAAS